MDYLFGMNQYPYEALWMERNQPLTIDNIVTYEGAIPFAYRKVRNASYKAQDIPGLKEIKYGTTIRTKDSLRFKAKDQIKLNEKVYTIRSVEQVENDIYKDAKILYKHFNDYETELILE